MKKVWKHMLVCGVALILVISCTVMALETSNTFPIFGFIKNFKSNVSNQPLTFTYNGKTYKNEYERLLAEDGLIFGMDVDWFSDPTQGNTSLGDSEITGVKNGYNELTWRKNIYNIKALGFNAVNLWVLTGGAVDGVSFDDKGIPTGLHDNFVANLKSLLDTARDVGIDVVPTLVPHGLSSYFYRVINELTPQERAYKYYRFYWDGADSEARTAYLENVIAPICEILSDYQDIIPIVGLTVENASMVNDPENGIFYSESPYGHITWDNFASFINDLGDEVKKVMPSVMTSVEDVGQGITSRQFYYNDLNVDIIGRNLYDISANVTDPQDLFITKPTYIGEFNTSEASSGDYTAEKATDALLKFYPNAQKAGYKGAFFFCWDRGAGSGLNMFDGSSSSNYAQLRVYGVPLAYQISEMKNQYRKDAYGTEIPQIDKPALFYYTGGNEIYWVGTKGAESYEVQRKLGNSEWEKVAELSQDDALNNGLFCYNNKDNYELSVAYREKNGVLPQIKYRVIATDENGNKSTSEEGNSAEYFIPENLLKDGSFENVGAKGLESNVLEDGGWYQVGGAIGEFVKDSEQARTGEYCLHIDHAKDIGYHDRDYGAQLINKVTLEPGKKYAQKFWYKNSVTADWAVIVKINDSDGTELAVSIFGTPEDDEWHQAVKEFTAPADGKVTITVIFNHEGSSEPFRCYMDDVAIEEVR